MVGKMDHDYAALLRCLNEVCLSSKVVYSYWKHSGLLKYMYVDCS